MTCGGGVDARRRPASTPSTRLASEPTRLGRDSRPFRDGAVRAQVRWAPETPLQNYLALGLANNVKDTANANTRERVIGVRGPSLWQAALEHPAYDQLPTNDRLLLCCCMNIDEMHPLRLEHYLILNKHPEFACAAREKKHLGEPITDPREHACTRVSRSRHRDRTRSPSDAHDRV